MKKYSLPLFALLVFAFSCKKDGDKPPIPSKAICKPTTENYVTGMIADEQVCWEDREPFTFTIGGTSTCDPEPGFENLYYKFLAPALWVSRQDNFRLNYSIVQFSP